MKNKLAVFVLILLPGLILSQEKFNNIQTPSSPASWILGLQPTAILTPKSYEALETALYSNFLDNDNNMIIPNDFALEFTPYWAKDHGLSLMDYLFPENELDQILRSSSFSISSTQKFLLGDSSATNGLAFGYRASLFFGCDKDTITEFYEQSKMKKKIFNLISNKAQKLRRDSTEIKTKEDFLYRIKGTLIDAMLINADRETAEKFAANVIFKANSIKVDYSKDRKKYVDAFMQIVDEQLKGEILFNEFGNYIKKRHGLYIDFAYANFINFPSNDIEMSYVPRQSVWITPTVRLKGKADFLKIMGVLRYEWYKLSYYKKYFENSKIYENNIDYGLAIATEFEKFALNLEMVGRNSNSEIRVGMDDEGNELYRKDKNSDFQCIGTFSYNLTDQIIISYSFGNRFDPILNPSNTLVSLFSLNLGVGAPEKN